ncbi:MAG: type IV secretion system DNA-binding domain-containing protein [Candidatus Pacebacteria bacterium]|nr:type IV secretion system DNA-binding domain-containing protein [Candidatus Paceibacterota bacterium]
MENPERVTYFAATDSRGKRTPFGIKAKDRSRHMYVIGKTGMGKSTMLENMAIQDIRNGEGLAFIDPHGGTADKLLDYIPQNRIDDVVYFAPFDLDQPIAFNVMEDVGYDKRHLVVSGLMATFKKIWVDAWSARMEYILSNTLLALLEYPDATLLGVNRMYTDKAYRKKVIDNVKDPVVKDFWVKEFNTYTDRYTQEATPAIQNKIGQFTSNPLIRNIIGQPKSSFDIRDLMDRKKILIINLSKGQVGETNMRLLGSMLTTRIFLGAMSRADLSARDIDALPPFYFYVDEFQNFANDTFAEILSEARKYKLNLTIAHQYVEQMEEQVRAAVFGNVGTTVAFRVGPFDAETLETVFSPEFMKEDLVNLTFAQVYLTLMIDGVGSRPFSAVTIPPIEPPAVVYRKEVIQASRTHFGSQRAAIEQSILDELSVSDSTEMPETTKSEQRASRAPYRRTPDAREARPPRDIETRTPRREAAAPRSDRPREVHVEAPSEHHDRPRPAPPTKSADDLKAILRTMTGSQKKAAPAAPKGSLKDALSDALKNPPPPASPRTDPSLGPTLEKVVNQPFEVPEDTLRNLFKEA